MVATALSVGNVAIIQVNSDDSDDPHIGGTQNMQRDSISFVLLAPVGSDTVIYFTDRTWNGSAFAAGGGDGTYAWTAAADLAAGTVITVSEAELTAAGIELLDAGEAVYVYQGPNANTPTTFLHAVEYGDLNDSFGASLLNTGLVAGASALAIAEDNGSFGERVWHRQAPELFQSINSNLNWHSNENSPQTNHVEGSNVLVAPDVQLWIAGISGGHGIISVSGDATQNGGLGYNVQTHFQNTSNDGDGVNNTSRFWSPTHILFDTVEGKFFVVDSSGTFDRILQGNISDMLTNPGVAPTMTILWQDDPAGVSDSDGITGMQVDLANNHIYFTANNQLLRANYNSADQTAVVLADLGVDSDSGVNNFANEIALDLPNGRAFIISTESFSDFVELPPGSGNIVVGTVMNQNSIHMVSSISSSDIGPGGNTIVQLNFNEAVDEDNGPYGAQSNEFDDAFGRITDVDINHSTGEIWFTTVQLNGGMDGSVGGIFRATLDAGTNTLNVVHIYSETNATNFNFLHIHIDEETGFYYVTSVEPNESGEHSVFRGALNAAPGTAPTFFATVGNINDMTPRDLTVESAPTLAGTAQTPTVPELDGANSGETAGAVLYSGLTASDIDTTGGDELAGAQVRISGDFQSGATHQDFLRINGNTSGAITGITYTYDSATGVMTLSGAATVTEYAAALALVTFSMSGDNPTLYGTAGSRTVSASVFDGLLHSDEIHATVTVVGVNDAPVNGLPGISPTVNEEATVAITGLSVSDPDADPATQDITVTLSVSNGTLDIRTDVTNGVASGDVSGDGTGTITITATINQINATLANATGLQYTGNLDFNGSDSLVITTNDGGLNGTDPGGDPSSEQDQDTLGITVTPLNDAPALANVGVGGLVLEQTFVLLDTDASVSDVDLDPLNSGAGNYTGASLTIQRAVANAEDEFSFDTTGAGFTESGGVLLVGGNAFATFSVTGGVLTINFDGAAAIPTSALVDDVMRHVTYRNASDTPPVTVTLGYTFDDGSPDNGQGNPGGAPTSTGSVTVIIAAVNDAPVAGISPLDYAIGEQVALNLKDNGLSISDPDSGSGDLTVTLSVGAGVLNAVAGDSGVIVGGSAASVTLTGTVAEINAFLGAGGTSTLTYTQDTDTPVSTTLTLGVNDGGNTGTGGALTDDDTATITITAENDAPDADISAASYNATEQVALNLKNTGLSVADVDGLGGTATVTLSVDAGILNLSAGGSGAIVTGSGTGSVEIEGTIAQINALLSSDGTSLVAFVADSDTPAASATVTLAIDDNGFTGTGGDRTDFDTATINVTAVNDAARAFDDADFTFEDMPFSCDVFMDHGLGADFDPEGDPFQVIAVSGGGAIGTQFALPSGALLTLNADGTFDYDPNGAFDHLPQSGSGASNTVATDTFTYTITGGATATMTMTIVGIDTDDILEGTAGNDNLFGGEGNDRFIGDAGADNLSGQFGESDTGNDTVDYSLSGTGVTVDLAAGTGSGGFAAGDSYEGIENAIGSGQADTLIGGAQINVLDGGGGNDVLRGGAGTDTLIGGAGSDTASYTGSNFRVAVSLLTGYTAGGHALNDTLIAIENLEGSSFDDAFAGNHSANILSGGDGDDRFLGRGGGDTLNGGNGSDTTDYSDSNAGVAVSLATGFTAGGHAAGDTFSSIENIYGSNLADTLAGDGQDNILQGRRGGDALHGFGGSDTASYAQSNFAVAVSLATGFAAGGHAAGDTFFSIENLTGSAFNDALVGNNASNVLQGLAGNDTLNGLGGSDTASYAESNAGVAVSLLTGFVAGGHAAGDTFVSIESLTGSAFNDTLVGNNSANLLTGLAGNDALRGNGGVDRFAFGDGFGQDTIQDWVNGELFDFSGSTQIGAFGDLTIGSSGGDAVITDGLGNQITVNGGAGQVDASDFVF